MSGRTSLRIERLLRSSVDDVFAAWTDPRSMGEWLAPEGHAEVEADVRVGGYFRVVMIGPERRIEHTGEYLVVEPPRRLSFTWVSPYTGDGPSVVTVELASEGDSTRLVLKHERLPEEAVDSHEQGWGSILQRLAVRLDGPA